MADVSFASSRSVVVAGSVGLNSGATSRWGDTSKGDAAQRAAIAVVSVMRALAASDPTCDGPATWAKTVAGDELGPV